MSELLKPHQIRTLEQLAAQSKSAPIRRRANVLLLYQAGKSTHDIADVVGLSPNRVRYWRRQFGTKGMAIFSGLDISLSGDGMPRQARETDLNTSTSFDMPPVVSDPPTFDLNDPALFVNRELSLLEFQRRVLEEAQDKRNPLLERVKFLAIVGSNLDEFFMVRVGGLKKQIAAGVTDLSPDGRTPAEQLAAIRKVAQELMEEAQIYLQEELAPELAAKGIFIYNYDDLSEKHRGHLKKYFDEVIFPVLTPLAFDPGHPFPHISNLSLNLAVLIRDENGREHFARVKVPGSIPRLLPIKRSSGSVRKDGTVPYKHHFVWVEQVIAANLEALFPGMEIIEAHPFRITRNADMVIQELEADDLLETMEESVRQRRFGAVVRATVNPDMPPRIRNILINNLNLDRNDGYVLEGPLGLSSLMNLYGNIERYELRDTPFVPFTPPQLKQETRDSDVFSAIRRESFLIQHPYDSFTPVVDFLERAAEDPKVLAIKQTLYRVGKNSPVVRALLKARENGKQVAVLVELKARFDEESNIGWAKVLEQQGVHVIYGLVGLKTHSKIALVIRKEGDHIRRYIHLATGNYNAVTAHLYEDLGFFTSDEDIGADATDLFNFLTGYSDKRTYRKLLIAPINLRTQLEALIRREMEHQRQGREGHLIFKTNSLIDKPLTQLLYQASQAGVKIDLIVRGICGLRPGIPGLSDNITVTSIVGRFLEHSRIYYFRNGGDEDIYLGSADLMPRNINRRVEILFPIEEKRFIRHLRGEVLATYLTDNAKARRMQSDGTYTRVLPGEDEDPVNVQEWLLHQRVRQIEEEKKHPWENF
ncbi:MAG: polyphosphate kinase 1 [Rhodothermales bacterium]